MPSYPRGDASWLHNIRRTHDTFAALVEHVGVAHRGAHILMTEQFLDSADAVARFQQMRSKAVPKGVTTRWLVHPGGMDGFFHRPL
jgi:hypothetical protein